MATLPLWRPALAAGFVALALGLSCAARAADDKAGPPSADRKALDQQIQVTLGNVIDRGAGLYNGGDQAACYRLFEGALMTVRPQLDHRPSLQKAIDAGFVSAGRGPTAGHSAFALRDVIDRIRREVSGKSAEEVPVVKPLTLWQRLGGDAQMDKAVERFLARAVKNPAVDFSRGGTRPIDAAALARMKKPWVAFLSHAAGGPHPYDGKSMKEAHQGMEITDAQFDALLADLKTALLEQGAKPPDAEAMVTAVGASRKDIVAVKPPPDKAGKVTGKVLVSGQPLGDADVELHPMGNGQKGAQAKTAADGTISLPAVAPGPYRVLISKQVKKDGAVKNVLPEVYASRTQSPLTVDVQAGNNYLFVLDLKAVAEQKPPEMLTKVRGEVAHNGIPLSGAEIRLVPENDRRASGYSVTLDQDGKFTLAAVRPGRYVIVVLKSQVQVPKEWTDTTTSRLILEVAP